MPEPLSPADVAHIANLARLELTSEEQALFAAQLSSVLEHVASLQRLDTTDVPPTSHPLQLSNVFRPDVVVPSLASDAVLAAAPAAEDGRFKVPRVLGEAP